MAENSQKHQQNGETRTTTSSRHSKHFNFSILSFFSKILKFHKSCKNGAVPPPLIPMLILLLLLSLILLLGTVRILMKRKKAQLFLSVTEAGPEPAKKKAQFVLFKPGKNIEDAAIEAKIDIERERSEIEADKARKHAKEDIENEELRKTQTIQLMLG